MRYHYNQNEVIYEEYEGTYAVYYTKSENSGNTWSTPSQIDDGSSGGRYGLTITSNGDNIVAAWIDTWNYDIYSVSVTIKKPEVSIKDSNLDYAAITLTRYKNK